MMLKRQATGTGVSARRPDPVHAGFRVGEPAHYLRGATVTEALHYR